MKSLPTLDLHGFVVADVADAVDRFLMQKMRAGSPRVRIMTGKGTGAVKKTTIEYLRLGGFPFEFEKTAQGTRNEGVILVFLGDGAE